MLIYLYTDGASRSNPGLSASGYKAFDASHKLLLKGAFFNGIKTNNEAEYLALISGLEKVAEEFGFKNDVMAYSDSKLMSMQLSGEYKVREDGLKKLFESCKHLSSKFGSFSITHVPRENTAIASVDKELNLLLDAIEKDRAGQQASSAD